ncbi:hypothetical protein [Burkholderia oklahomensis]|uniref:hypothetical protein n=1 Tax=Burkholderia oklahomensis TaxID=342113 RepID=UPI0003148018|nr:hypothetical protein [Burkholderia oklahomensis]QPS39410.1 hypothetical protein I6G57_26555 [Burkholderia oklahomensis]
MTDRRYRFDERGQLQPIRKTANRPSAVDPARYGLHRPIAPAGIDERLSPRPLPIARCAVARPVIERSSRL